MRLTITQGCTSLEQCIWDAQQEEQLDETESLRCPLTLMPETTCKSTAIERLPQQLLIQLKRFTSYGKNNAAVQIPRRLTLQSSTQGPMQYNISAAVIHHGGLHNGHYTAIIFSGCNAAITYCDDTSTRSISWASAERLLQQAYLFAYSQTSL